MGCGPLEETLSLLDSMLVFFLTFVQELDGEMGIGEWQKRGWWWMREKREFLAIRPYDGRLKPLRKDPTVFHPPSSCMKWNEHVANGGFFCRPSENSRSVHLDNKNIVRRGKNKDVWLYIKL